MKLIDLEKVAFDPMLSGRQEEIWARLSVLRERAQLLKNETENLSKKVQTSAENPLDDDQMRKVEKILGDYVTQLNELQKELSSAEKDFAEWNSSTNISSSRQ